MKPVIRYSGILIVAIGILFILFEPLTDWRINRLSNSIVQTAEHSQLNQPVSTTSETHYDFEAVEELSFSSFVTLPRTNQLQAKGVLTMPEVDMELPILDGLSEENLLAGAGTMKEDQLPGEGNYALAGHNWHDRTTLFSALHRAEEGMSVFLSVDGEVYEYVVTTIEMVDPSRIDVIDDRDYPLLTLVTCNHDGTERLIVQAELV